MGRTARRLGLVALLATGLAGATAGAAAAADRYISDTGCSDSYAGTSATDTGTNGPWCSLTKVNAVTFSPGDSILLKRGATWTGQTMTFTESGTSGSHLTLGAYGSASDPRPQIAGTGGANEMLVSFTDASYWDVRDLELSDAAVGLHFMFTGFGNEGITVDDVYVHDFRGVWFFHTLASPAPPAPASPLDPPYDAWARTNSVSMASGILFTVPGSLSFTDGDYAARDIEISNVEGTHNVDSVSISPFDNLDSASADDDGAGLFRDVVLRNLDLHDDDGHADSSYQAVRMGCSDGLRVINSTNVLIVNSTLRNEASCHTQSGTAAFVMERTEGLRFVNSIVESTPYTGSPDQTGIDLETLNKDSTFSHGYFAENAGNGIEILTFHAFLGDPDYWQLNTTFAGNSFVRNGNAGEGPGLSIGTGATPDPDGTISDNLAFQGGPWLTGGAGFTTTNNIDLFAAGAGDVNYAAKTFGGTQRGNGWYYNYRPGGGSSAQLPSYDAAERRWHAGSGDYAITPFEMHPGACSGCEVQRVWVAPHSGTISIRGHLLKSVAGGDGVVARIRKTEVPSGSTSQLWPSSGDYSLGGSDRDGTYTDLDGIAVHAGDLIWFDVGAGGAGDAAGDLVSWVPAIAYTANASSEYFAFDWGFGTNGDSEGWTDGNQVSQSVSGGIDTLTTTGSDPYVVSRPGLYVDGTAYRYVKVRMRNNTSGTTARLRFTTASDGTWDNAKSKVVAINASDPGYTEYQFDMAGVAGWDARGVTQLQLVPTTAAGTVDVDWIRMSSLPTESTLGNWSFATNGDSMGWVNGVDASMSVSGGVNTVTSTGPVPYILSAQGLGFDLSDYKYVKVRMKNNTSSTEAHLYFLTTADMTWDSAKAQKVTISAHDATYKDYVFDFSGYSEWAGTLYILRFDPICTTGTADIDQILISNTPF